MYVCMYVYTIYVCTCTYNLCMYVCMYVCNIYTMASRDISHLDIGPRLRLGPISRCLGLIFAIYTEKPWYI